MSSSVDLKDQIVHALQVDRNERNREPMEAYMRNHFRFLGIKTPERKQILKPIFNEWKQITETDRMTTAKLLFQQPERECHYAGLALLEKGKKKAPRSAIAVYKELLLTSPWWDTVDMIASSLCGSYFQKYPEYLVPITENWRHSRHLWVRRSSVLHQLKYKEKTNEKLLFDTVDALKKEREFFIEKAIGWALREYSKTNPEAVVQYLERTDCRPLSRREGMKWLKKQDLINVSSK